MYFLGLDTGYARLGYGIISLQQKKKNHPQIEDYGIFETARESSDGDRLLELESKLARLLQEKPVVACAVEEVFFRKNLSTGVRLLQARGVILLTLARSRIPVLSVSPTRLKKMLTGYGSADKRQVQNMVARLLNLSKIPEPDDAADALALSLCSWLNVNSLVEQTKKKGAEL